MRIETAEDAAMLRDVLQPIWAQYYTTAGTPETVASTNMCCRTAAMIAEIDPRWTVVHGTLASHPHAWCRRNDGTVIDLTADQFGWPPVVWGALPPGYVEAEVTDDCPRCTS